jgi:hypothetical protein
MDRHANHRPAALERFNHRVKIDFRWKKPTTPIMRRAAGDATGYNV